VKGMTTLFKSADFGLPAIGKLRSLNSINYLDRDQKYRPSIQTDSETPIFANQKLPISGLPPHRFVNKPSERIREN
jgi:hypothetical protein